MTGSSAEIVRIVRQCLKRGGTVEIDGLGWFIPDGGGAFRFVPQTRPKVFLAYVVEDAPAAERLYDALQKAGFDPWLDRRKLLPGQNWPRAIEQAIAVSDFFVACLSPRSVAKRGRFQAELRRALEYSRRQPLDAVFLIPVRLEDCEVPAAIVQEFQYVDLFPDWNRGFAQLAAAMRHQARRPLPLAG